MLSSLDTDVITLSDELIQITQPGASMVFREVLAVDLVPHFRHILLYQQIRFLHAIGIQRPSAEVHLAVKQEKIITPLCS